MLRELSELKVLKVLNVLCVCVDWMCVGDAEVTELNSLYGASLPYGEGLLFMVEEVMLLESRMNMELYEL